VGPLAVVALQPGVGEIADLGDRFKGIGIEDFGAIAAIEAFDICVRASRCDRRAAPAAGARRSAP